MRKYKIKLKVINIQIHRKKKHTLKMFNRIRAESRREGHSPALRHSVSPLALGRRAKQVLPSLRQWCCAPCSGAGFCFPD